MFAAIFQTLPLTVAPASAAPAQTVGFEYAKLLADKAITSKVNLGALATRTQGAAVTRSGLSAPWTMTGTDSNGVAYSEPTSGDKYNGTYSPSSYAAWGYEGKDVTGIASTFTSTTDNNATLTDPGGQAETGVIKIATSGNISAHNNLCSGHACYGSVFGPELYSQTFSVTAGQSASFRWAAQAGADDYEFYAFLVKLSASECAVADTGYGSAVDNSLFVHSRGGNQNWTWTTAKIGSSGCYRVRFVSGTYDSTGGKAVGSSLYLKSVLVIGTPQTITFNTPTDIVAANASAANAADFTTSASTNATGNSVTFTSLTPTICTVTSSGAVDIKANDPATPRSCTLVASAGPFGEYTAADDVGRTFQIKTTASKPVYSGGAALTGSASVCNTLTVNQGSWNTGGAAYLQEFTYLDFNGIDTVTASSRILTAGDVGKSIRATIVKQNSAGWETATTTLVSVVDATFSAITSSVGTFAPTFSTCETSYSLSTETSTITVTPTAAGSTITVNGTSVSSGSASGAINLAVGSNSITVVSTKSSVSFTVTLNITRTVSAPNSPPPACEQARISDISPTVIPVIGGTYVTVNGYGLTNSIYVDNSPVSLRTTGSQQIVFISPAHTKGIVAVRIDGCSGSSSVNIEYDSSPRVLSYAPDNGSSLGGTTVVVSGTQLGNASALVGGSGAALLSNTESNLTLSTPQGTPGITSIVVSTQYGLVSLPFTYYAPPEFLTFTSPYIQQGELIEFVIESKFADSVELHSGQLPPGLSLVSPLGTLTGIPTKAGIYNFQLIAKGKGGQVVQDFQLEVDKPIPDDIHLNVRLSFDEIQLCDTCDSNLQEFMKLAEELTPKKFKPLMYSEGGAQITIKYPIVDELGKLRHASIRAQAITSGVALTKTISNYCLGYKGTVRITISWKKKPGDFVACENKALEVSKPSAQPEIESKVLTLKVYFPMGSQKIASSEKQKIKALAKRIQGLTGVVQVSVNGFAQPTKGTELSDLALSKARAVQVSDFLGSLGISGIVEVAGKGRTNLNVASSRYVEIVVKVNPNSR